MSPFTVICIGAPPPPAIRTHSDHCCRSVAGNRVESVGSHWFVAHTLAGVRTPLPAMEVCMDGYGVVPSLAGHDWATQGYVRDGLPVWAHIAACFTQGRSLPRAHNVCARMVGLSVESSSLLHSELARWPPVDNARRPRDCL